MFVIGLGYKARHGKNYVAKTMIQHAAMRGIQAKEYGFATALKAVCRVQFGMKEKDAPLLQMVGTDLYRRQNPNVWVDVLAYQLAEESPTVAIITDMRFPNEAKMVTESFKGVTVRVTRLDARTGRPWAAPDRDPHHTSETALDDYVLWADNISVDSGNLALLDKRAVEVFDAMYERRSR